MDEKEEGEISEENEDSFGVSSDLEWDIESIIGLNTSPWVMGGKIRAR